MLAERHIAVSAADFDPHPVAQAVAPVRLACPVKSRPDQREADFDASPMRRGVARREVAVDAVIDRDIVDLDADRLGDVERPVLLDPNLAVIIVDPLFG